MICVSQQTPRNKYEKISLKLCGLDVVLHHCLQAISSGSQPIQSLFILLNDSLDPQIEKEHHLSDHCLLVEVANSILRVAINYALFFIVPALAILALKKRIFVMLFKWLVSRVWDLLKHQHHDDHWDLDNTLKGEPDNYDVPNFVKQWFMSQCISVNPITFILLFSLRGNLFPLFLKMAWEFLLGARRLLLLRFFPFEYGLQTFHETLVLLISLRSIQVIAVPIVKEPKLVFQMLLRVEESMI